MLTLTNRIDMRPGAVPLVIHLGQYDSDFSLVFELYSSAGNFTVESGTTAMIRGTKTDGHAYDADATIDVSAKTVTVAGNEQMTAAKGRNVYELVLKKGTKVLSTANFILDVERAAMDADTIASESVLKELNAIIDSAATSTQAAADAASAADRAEDAADSISSASAQIATNTADISDLKADLSQTFSDDAKRALMDCLDNLEWIHEDGDLYKTALKRALHLSNRNPNLPSEYEQVEYIEATGTQFIQTDILSQIPFRVVGDMKLAGTAQPTAVGAGVSSVATSRFFMLACPYDSGANRIGNRFANDTVTWTEDGATYTSGWLNIRELTFDRNTRYTIESAIEYAQTAGKAITSVSCNGHTVSVERNTPTVGYPIYFFYQSNASTPTEGTLYSCKFYSGATLLFDAVPCYRKSDNVAGIYDVVGNKFYTNVGTGTFEVGEIVV